MYGKMTSVIKNLDSAKIQFFSYDTSGNRVFLCFFKINSGLPLFYHFQLLLYRFLL
jgi:hypothetical protein